MSLRRLDLVSSEGEENGEFINIQNSDLDEYIGKEEVGMCRRNIPGGFWPASELSCTWECAISCLPELL